VQAALAAQVIRVVDDGLKAFTVTSTPRVTTLVVNTCWAEGGRPRRTGCREKISSICSGRGDVEVVGDEGFEEPAGMTGLAEHDGSGDLDLAHRQFPPVTGGVVVLGQRQRQDRDPVLEEGLDGGWAEPVTDALQPDRIVGGGEPVEQLGEPDPGPGGLAFGPLMTVDPVFYVNLPIGLVALIALIRGPRSIPRRTPFDLPGQLSATLALAAITYAVIERSVAALVACGVASAVFVIVEQRSAHPMVPPRLVRRPSVAVPTATGLALNFAFYGAVFLLALYFEQVRGLSALETGLMFLPMTALITVMNLLAGRLTTRYGPRLPMALGQAVLVGGVCGLLALQHDTPLVVQAAVLLPFGLGGGLAVPALTAALLESVDADRAGLAAGLLNAGRQFGGALGVALFGSLTGGAVVTGLHMGALVAAAAPVATTIATVVFVRPGMTGMTAHGQQDEPLARSGVPGSGARADCPG